MNNNGKGNDRRRLQATSVATNNTTARRPRKGVFRGLVLSGIVVAGAWASWNWKGPELVALMPGATEKASATFEPPAGLQKCVRDGKVLYTTDKCPDGTSQAAMSGGSLSVIPAVRPARAEPASKLPAAIPGVQQLLDPGQDIKARNEAIDQALGTDTEK